jgi:hypothetical protein
LAQQVNSVTSPTFPPSAMYLGRDWVQGDWHRALPGNEAAGLLAPAEPRPATFHPTPLLTSLPHIRRGPRPRPPR